VEEKVSPSDIFTSRQLHVVSSPKQKGSKFTIRRSRSLHSRYSPYKRQDHKTPKAAVQQWRGRYAFHIFVWWLLHPVNDSPSSAPPISSDLTRYIKLPYVTLRYASHIRFYQTASSPPPAQAPTWDNTVTVSLVWQLTDQLLPPTPYLITSHAHSKV